VEHARLVDKKMPAVVDPDECVGCETCVDECSRDAISLNEDDIAVVDGEKCDECGTCVEACPTEAISIEEKT
jgi:ferredoxin